MLIKSDRAEGLDDVSFGCLYPQRCAARYRHMDSRNEGFRSSRSDRTWEIKVPCNSVRNHFVIGPLGSARTWAVGDRGRLPNRLTRSHPQPSWTDDENLSAIVSTHLLISCGSDIPALPVKVPWGRRDTSWQMAVGSRRSVVNSIGFTASPQADCTHFCCTSDITHIQEMSEGLMMVERSIVDVISNCNPGVTVVHPLFPNSS
ncbi:hypothetical protein LZ30DRAFT_240981 [Colletotrichum cereale]|nr:hypothetical protein LZ30DRAFT_240981 [Colletotrichum cereale]